MIHKKKHFMNIKNILFIMMLGSGLNITLFTQSSGSTYIFDGLKFTPNKPHFMTYSINGLTFTPQNKKVSILTHIKEFIFQSKCPTNLEFDNWHNATFVRISRNKKYIKGIEYSNNTIAIQKKHSNKVSAHQINDLEDINNAYITRCSGFSIIEHGATTQNKTLCNDVAILQAYENYKINHENNER